MEGAAGTQRTRSPPQALQLRAQGKSGSLSLRWRPFPTASLLWEALAGERLDLRLAQGLGPYAASNPFASQKFRDEWPAHA